MVPPRPKPGRKPATDEPASKRKAQNRESQRAFRARKAAKLTEMQTQVEIAEQRHRIEMSEKMMEMDAKDMRISQLEVLMVQLGDSDQRNAKESEFWKNKAIELEEHVKRLEEQLKSSSELTPPVTSVPLPPRRAHHSAPPVKDIPTQNTLNDTAISFEDREIDFTAQFATKRRPEQPSIAFLTQPNDDHPSCGFCTDMTFCLCRDAKLQGMPSNDDVPLTHSWSDTRTEEHRSTSTDAAITGPGSCADCMRDPKQRAWCQRVAQLKDPAADDVNIASSSRNSSFSGELELEPMEPRASYAPVSAMNMTNQFSIGCSDAYKLFDGRVATGPDSMDWSTLKPMVPDAVRGALPSIEAASMKYSALELDTASVIATLQQTMGPLVPRKEDGPHAELVRIAGDFRGSPHSPQN